MGHVSLSISPSGDLQETRPLTYHYVTIAFSINCICFEWPLQANPCGYVVLHGILSVSPSSRETVRLMGHPRIHIDDIDK